MGPQGVRLHQLMRAMSLYGGRPPKVIVVGLGRRKPQWLRWWQCRQCVDGEVTVTGGRIVTMASGGGVNRRRRDRAHDRDPAAARNANSAMRTTGIPTSRSTRRHARRVANVVLFLPRPRQLGSGTGAGGRRVASENAFSRERPRAVSPGSGIAPDRCRDDSVNDGNVLADQHEPRLAPGRFDDTELNRAIDRGNFAPTDC